MTKGERTIWEFKAKAVHENLVKAITDYLEFHKRPPQLKLRLKRNIAKSPPKDFARRYYISHKKVRG